MTDDIIDWLYDYSGQVDDCEINGRLTFVASRLESQQAEIERLRRWQSQATTVIENWDAVFDALIDAKPTDLGVSKSVLVAKEIIRLRCDNGELRTRIEELEEARRG